MGDSPKSAAKRGLLHSRELTKELNLKHTLREHELLE